MRFTRELTQKGFTLIEAMIVLVIIALLLTLAVPDMKPQTAKKQLAEVLTFIDENNIKGAVKASRAALGDWPNSNEQAGLSQPTDLVSNYITSVSIENGVINVTLGHKILENINGQILSIQPLIINSNPNGPIDWRCGYASVPDVMSAVGTNKTDINANYLPLKCLQ